MFRNPPDTVLMSSKASRTPPCWRCPGDSGLIALRSRVQRLLLVLGVSLQHEIADALLRTRIPDCRRAITSVTLLTAYAAASWTRAENHLCVAQGWLTACVTLMRFATVRKLDIKLWLASYDLALEAARTALASLSREAAEAKDLVVPDMMDGLVYPSRALLVCGFLGAYLLSERTLGDI